MLQIKSVYGTIAVSHKPELEIIDTGQGLQYKILENGLNYQAEITDHNNLNSYYGCKAWGKTADAAVYRLIKTLTDNEYYKADMVISLHDL